MIERHRNERDVVLENARRRDDVLDHGHYGPMRERHNLGTTRGARGEQKLGKVIWLGERITPIKCARGIIDDTVLRNGQADSLESSRCYSNARADPHGKLNDTIVRKA